MNHQSPVDLHLHSTASDGTLSPAALVEHVAAHGVRLMALTDHDTIAGVAEAAAAARRQGIGFVAGVEISVSWRGRSLHLLGLAVDPGSQVLLRGLDGQRTLREERGERIAERLEAKGAPGRRVLASLRERGALPTRMHFARELAALGLAPDPGAAFARWLARGRPGDVRADWPALAVATAWIAAAGGKAVIAHPMRYALSAGARRELAAEFAAAGGHAIEVITGGGSPGDRELAISLAVRNGLAASAGSDFHDPAIPWNPPGRLAKLPGSVRPVWRGAPFPELAADPETA
ncbi:MAG: PHP domain-containing protein [Gammaproteobacteria bacterium]